jgi:quercetin dioxygenase-like cupin family protein
MSTAIKTPDTNTKLVDAHAPVLIVEAAELKPVNYEWGAIKWLCDMNITPGSQQSFGYAYVLPGKTNPEHRHMSCQEVIYMLSGEIKLYAHGRWLRLRPGQTMLIPQGVRHLLINEGWEPAVYIASFSAAARQTVFKGETGKLDSGEALY